MSKYLSKYARELREKERKEREAFGVKLTKLLLRRGLTQTDVARLMWPGKTTTDSRGYSSAYGRDRLSVWCLGSARPTPLNMKLLCSVLKVDANELWPDFDWTDDVEQAPVVKTKPGKMPVVTYEPSPFQEGEYVIKSINRLVSAENLMRIVAILIDAEDGKAGKPAEFFKLFETLQERVHADGKRIVIRPN